MAERFEGEGGEKQDANRTDNVGPARNAEIDDDLAAAIDPPEGFKEVLDADPILGGSKSTPD